MATEIKVDVFEIIRNVKIVPVIKLDSVEQAVPLAEALFNGGIPVAEVTFRTSAAAASISAIRKALPQMIVGAGTVINTEYARLAIDAGAQFIVSPGLNLETIKYVQSFALPMIPGVATPSEIEVALCNGLDVLKLFPAEVLGGTKMLDALKGPFPHVKFLPTGGINEKNMLEYLNKKNVLAVGGSWMISPDFNQVTELCIQAKNQLNLK